jgi:hypothetical protein
VIEGDVTLHSCSEEKGSKVTWKRAKSSCQVELRRVRPGSSLEILLGLQLELNSGSLWGTPPALHCYGAKWDQFVICDMVFVRLAVPCLVVCHVLYLQPCISMWILSIQVCSAHYRT